MHGQNSNTLSMTEVDQITYQQYLKGEWDELIKTGKEAKKEGINFYFLDVRMGIAYYHKKKYRKAIKFLGRAFKKDEKNAVVAEYLYYAYIYGGRYMDAVRMSNDLYLSVKEKIGLHENKFIDEMGFDFKIEFPDDYSIDLNQGNIDQDVITQNTYWGINIGNYYGKGNLLWFSGGRFKRDYTKYSYEDNQQKIGEKSITQSQYYLAHYSQIGSGMNFGFGVNWLLISYDDISYQRIGRNGRIIIVPSTNIINQFVGFIAIRKDFGNFKLGVNTTASNLQDNLQIQIGADFYWYPLANTDLYFFIKPNYKMEDMNDAWVNDQLIKGGLGVRLGKIYLEPAYTYGDIYNYNESDGLLVYNDAEKISDKAEITTYGFFFKGRLKLFTKYQHYSKTNYFSLNDNPTEINYTNQTLTIGALWKF
jgi:hypothetical protein